MHRDDPASDLRTDGPSARPSFPHEQFEKQAADPRPVFSTGSSALFALWAGLATGLLEVLILVIRHFVEASSTLGALQMNRNFLWMIPVAQLVVFAAMSIPFLLISSRGPNLARRGLIFASVSLATFALSLMVEGLHDLAAIVLATGLGWRATKFVDTPRRMKVLRGVVRVTLPMLILGVGGLGGLCYQRLVVAERDALRALPAAAKGTPNVLLIVLDTLRADRLSLTGYRRPTTPNLDKLAARGAAFTEARSAAPWTFPSHATMFTGRWPHEMKLTGNRPLDATFPTLAEALSRRGLAPIAFIGNTYYCNSWYGLGRGFAHYEDYYEDNLIVSPIAALRCSALGRLLISMTGDAYNARPGTANAFKDAPRVNRDFLAWLDENPKPGRPFFAFLNYIDAHDPYTPHPERRTHFGRTPESAEEMGLLQTWHLYDKKKVDDRDLELLKDAYDDRVAFLDEQLGRLFSELERRGMIQDTLIVVTSDHGEGFGEHGLYLHGQSLYRSEVHVPLILAGPGVGPAGRRYDRPVSLRDLPATILDRIGSGSESPFPGRSLSRFWEGGSATEEAPIRSEVAVVDKVSRKPKHAPALRGPMASTLHEGYVYLRDALGAEELYHVASDPDETRNLAASPEHRAALERLRKLHDEEGRR